MPIDERPRVADVRARVDRRPAEVHAHRPGRRRQVDERLRVGVKEPHRSSAASRRAAAPRAPTRARARCRAGQRAPHRAQVAADRLQLADDRLRARPCRARRCRRSRSSRKRSSVARSSGSDDRRRLEDRRGELARLVQVVRAAQRGHDLDRDAERARRARRPDSAASTSTASERIRSRSRWTSWRGSPSSSR